MSRSGVVSCGLAALILILSVTSVTAIDVRQVIADKPSVVFGSLFAILLPTIFVFWAYASRPHPPQLDDKQCVDDTAPEGTVDAEVCIVGAGIAGASLAAYLGKAGIKTVLFERDMSEPDRIVGELLQPGGVAVLKEMGLEKTVEGIDAPRVHGYTIVNKSDSDFFPIDYPKDPQTGKIPEGRSFHHGRFIMNLRKAALEQKSVEVREATVSKLLRRGNRVTGVVYKDPTTKESREVRANLTVVVDGCYSALRKSLCKADQITRSHFLGLVLKGQPPFVGNGTVILAKPTPILVYPISSNDVRMLVDFPDKIPSRSSGELEKYLKETVLPQLPKSIHQSFLDAIEAQDMRSMPNRTMHAEPFLTPGVVAVGDALNMRHPLTGGGMTVAFTDVAALGKKIISQRNLSNISATTDLVNDFYQSRVAPACAINTLASALYDVFSFSNQDLREGCYEYLKNGGSYSLGPISLLSGLSRSQMWLVYHFFSVAFYSCWRLCKPFPTPVALWRSFFLIRDAVRIIMPIAAKENNNPAIVLFCKFVVLLFWV